MNACWGRASNAVLWEQSCSAVEAASATRSKVDHTIAGPSCFMSCRQGREGMQGGDGECVLSVCENCASLACGCSCKSYYVGELNYSPLHPQLNTRVTSDVVCMCVSGLCVRTAGVRGGAQFTLCSGATTFDGPGLAGKCFQGNNCPHCTLPLRCCRA